MFSNKLLREDDEELRNKDQLTEMDILFINEEILTT